jgi:hypothetical protein
MPIRWMVVGCFSLTSCIAAFAADPDDLSALAISAPEQNIPIYTGTDSSDSTSHFHVGIDPLITARTANASGVLADSDDEHVDAGYTLPLTGAVSMGYDTGINAFRQDQAIWDDTEATSQVTTSLINKGSIQIQTGPQLKWTDYIQAQRSLTDGQPGYSDATKYGTDAAWTPIKDVTTVSVDASTQTTYNFDHSILDEDLCTTALDQKLPWVPLTLHTAGSVTDDTSPTIALDDKDTTVINASLLWKMVPSTSLTTGVQRQNVNIPSSVQLANTDTYFTQVSVQAAQAVTFILRAAHDQTDTTSAGQFLSTNSDVLLTVGVNWNLGDRFNAGAGVNYRVLQSQTPATAISTPPATFSLSAGGKF